MKLLVFIIWEDAGRVLMLSVNPVDLSFVQIDFHVQFMTIINEELLIFNLLNPVDIESSSFELIIRPIPHWFFMMSSSTEFLHFSGSSHDTKDHIWTVFPIAQNFKSNLNFTLFRQSFVTIDLMVIVTTRINLFNLLPCKLISFSKHWFKVPIELKLSIHVFCRLNQW